MKKLFFLLSFLVVIVSFSFKSITTISIHSKVVLADTITSLSKQKIGSKSFFKAPNGKVYQVTFENPSEGLDRDKLHCDTDDFFGTARKTPKTTMVTADLENFNVLKTFLSGLPSDDSMINNPSIKASPNKRATEEKRNVKLTKVFLIAIKREPDNDYQGNFFNTENTGLISSSPQKLKDVRKAIVDFMGGGFCSAKYQKFSPGIPLELEGSLFYDTEHKPGIVGPSDARPKTSWEIHPISNIIFK
jgi:hypothetical protein